MEVVVNELKDHAGSQFDPDIVPYLLDMIDDGVAPVELEGDELMYHLYGKYIS